MSLQQKIDRITDILRRDDGISGAMHYTEQTSWVLFLKFLDDYESEKRDEAELSGKEYQPVLDEAHRWSTWACPKNVDGTKNLKADSGDDLIKYVNDELFPYLKSFANSIVTGGADPRSFAYKVGATFQYLDNKVVSGHTLREVLDIVDTLNFQSSDEMFELSLVYEGLLQNMGDAGGYAGEFYTPRPVVRAMIKAIDPKPGQTIYDAAAGSCGFLVEAFEHLKSKKSELSTEQWNFIQRDTFFGFEKTSLAYVMGMMNMILHGIESPNLYRGNTLTQNIRDIQEKDRYNIILANPPFGGKEKDQIQQNFPIKANATELLFMQHFMKTLKSGGKAAIVVPEGVLFQTNSAFKQVKQELLENFNLHTILSLPAGVFLPYSGVKTNVLFFERSGGTSDVWYYECEPEQKLTKNKPITDEHLHDFVDLYSSRKTTDRSWTVSASKLAEDYDLSAKNPSKQKDTEHLSPSDILKHIRTKEKLVSGLLDEIEDLFAGKTDALYASTLNELATGVDGKKIKLGELGKIIRGSSPRPKGDPRYYGGSVPRLMVADVTRDGRYVTPTIDFLTEDGALKSRPVPKGTLTIQVSGNPGMPAILAVDACIHDGFAALVEIDRESISTEYLYFSLLAVAEQNNQMAVGAIFRNLTTSQLREIEIVVPSHEKQLELVKQMNIAEQKVKALKAELSSQLGAIYQLQASILNSAFKGEL